MIAIFGGSFLEPNVLTYFFGNGIGTNIGSSIVWGSVAALATTILVKKVRAEWTRHKQHVDAHNEWVARHLARQHKQLTGEDADPHPYFENVAL